MNHSRNISGRSALRTIDLAASRILSIISDKRALDKNHKTEFDYRRHR
jgi:hypothetical protein